MRYLQDPLVEDCGKAGEFALVSVRERAQLTRREGRAVDSKNSDVWPGGVGRDAAINVGELGALIIDDERLHGVDGEAFAVRRDG